MTADSGDPINTAFDPEPRRALPAVYWLTRDKIAGRLQDVVQVWLTRPVPQRYEDGDMQWFAPLHLVDIQDTWFETWTLDYAWKCAGNGIPQTEIECTRVGLELPTVQA